jgi:hypothetical protein
MSHSVVDVEDVALAQRLVVRDAVADDVIDRGADRLGVAAVVERRRVGAVVHGELEGEPVEDLRRHTRADMLDQQIEPFGDQPAGVAHALEGLRAVDRRFGPTGLEGEGFVADHGRA